MAIYIVIESRIPELYDMHMACLLEAITFRLVTNTVQFELAINNVRYCGSFEMLQVKVSCRFHVPQTNNKWATNS